MSFPFPPFRERSLLQSFSYTLKEVGSGVEGIGGQSEFLIPCLLLPSFPTPAALLTKPPVTPETEAGNS